MNRGTAQFHQQQYGRAIADYSAVIERNPKHAAAHQARALAHLALGAKAEAERDLARARELEKDQMRTGR